MAGPQTPLAPVVQPRLGPVGWGRWAWRTLTSMRTALFLLLLLSVAAVPGSIFPQRNIDAGRVADYLAANPGIGPWLDRLSFFDVYTSPWFSAVYLLLVTSLIGCIVPRTRQHVRALRARPPRAPVHLDRLDAHTVVEVDGGPDEALSAAAAALRRRRYRVVRHPDASLGAEAGYLRETGNLVFHVALCIVIVGVAVGHLFGWRGDVIVPSGSTFASSVSSYDMYSPGPLVDSEKLPGFRIAVDRVDAQFEETPGSQFGRPRSFTAYLRTTSAGGGDPVARELSVNHPVNLDGADVYLLANGYAPVITVRDAAGHVLYRQATPFIAQDPTYRSVGAVKVTAAAPTQLGLSGYFLPTAEPTFADGPVSLFPGLGNPELAVSVWEGELFPGGRPQSVYSLDTTGMTPVTQEDGSPLLVRLAPGQSVDLPGGRGSITLESVERFAGLSVRVDPGKELTLVATLVAIAGLLASLLVRRRRVFVRVLPATALPDSGAGPSPRTVVAIGALAKSADAGLGALVTSLGSDLTGRR